MFNQEYEVLDSLDESRAQKNGFGDETCGALAAFASALQGLLLNQKQTQNKSAHRRG